MLTSLHQTNQKIVLAQCQQLAAEMAEAQYNARSFTSTFFVPALCVA